MRSDRGDRGFTLVELVMVIVVAGILAAMLAVFLRPVLEGYLATGRRAGLTDMADTALRRLGRDIRSAVPNSIRSPNAQCFELVPTSAGGRYRVAADGSGSERALDTTATTTAFDVLSPLSSIPAAGDWVVVDNQNTDDVYAGVNRAAVAAVTTPVSPNGTFAHRITLAAATQFPAGYNGGRFVVVPNNQQVVSYFCDGGVLYRKSYDFGASANACSTAAGTPAIVATNVANCTFVYNPNQGATQQSGFLWMQVEITEGGETVSLAHGVHVDNVP